MKAALEDLGARVVLFPTIEIVSPPDESIVEQAIEQLDIYEWIIFTSTNAVEHFFDYLARLNPEALFQLVTQQSLPKTAVVGPATGEALESYGVHPTLMAESFQAEGLVESFAALQGGAGRKVLIPRALEARDVLERELPQLSYEVTVAPVYQTVQADVPAEGITALAGADGIVFTSPSTVRNFINIFDGVSEGESAIDYVSARKIFSIGPVTTAELHKHPQLQDCIFEAPEFTTSSLVELIAHTL